MLSCISLYDSNRADSSLLLDEMDSVFRRKNDELCAKYETLIKDLYKKP